jgi:hypothetical protein
MGGERPKQGREMDTIGRSRAKYHPMHVVDLRQYLLPRGSTSAAQTAYLPKQDQFAVQLVPASLVRPRASSEPALLVAPHNLSWYGLEYPIKKDHHCTRHCLSRLSAYVATSMFVHQGFAIRRAVLATARISTPISVLKEKKGRRQQLGM